jgi:prepilin-type N-terminal cleavage/methylation domain-containing protein
MGTSVTTNPANQAMPRVPRLVYKLWCPQFSICNLQSAIPNTRRPTAFTLIELLIVLTVLGILAVLVVPRFSDAAQTSRENTLKDDLRYLRTQIVVFKAQHRDVPPGYPDGDASGTPRFDAFLRQMTSRTNEFCEVGATAACCLGPYLSKMPLNPVNGFSTVSVVANEVALPQADNTTGWIYKPQTLEIIPNLKGADIEGRAYSDY